MRRAARLLLLLVAPVAFVLAQEEKPVDPAVRDREEAVRAQRAYDAGRREEAVRVLRALHARGAGDSATHALLGHSLFELGKPGEARAEFVEALARGRLSSDVVLRIAEIDRARGGAAAALEALRLAALLVPDDERLPVATADAAVAAGRYVEAEHDYEEALQRTADPADVYLRLGNLYLKAERRDDALEAFRTADALGADGVARLVAELYLARGDHVLAAAAYERLLLARPDDAELELRCAELALAAGDAAGAARHAARVAGDAGAPLAARAQVLFGRALAAQGDAAAALRAWEAALDGGADAPDLHLVLGMHFHRAGAHGKAVRHLRAALDGGGPDRERQAALVESLLALGRAEDARAEIVRMMEEFGLDERVERLVARLAEARGDAR